MKLLNLILTSTVLLAGVVSPALAQDSVLIDVKLGPTAEAINDDLLRRAKAGLNGAIVVEKDGKVVLKAGYGWANRAQQLRSWALHQKPAPWARNVYRAAFDE